MGNVRFSLPAVVNPYLSTAALVCLCMSMKYRQGRLRCETVRVSLYVVRQQIERLPHIDHVPALDFVAGGGSQGLLVLSVLREQNATCINTESVPRVLSVAVVRNNGAVVILSGNVTVQHAVKILLHLANHPVCIKFIHGSFLLFTVLTSPPTFQFLPN